MRGRSPTMTRTSTRTRSVSFSARLALALSRQVDGPTLQSLPTEILLEILQTAITLPPSSTTAHRLGSSQSDNDTHNPLMRGPHIDYRTLRALALTSRLLAGLAHSIMYRTVAPDDPKRLSLFARTVLDCAHRDITLSSTLSPVSPVSITSLAFSHIPALFAGKFTTRLALEYPFIDSPRVSKSRGAELDRFYAATGALLGLGQSAPSVPSPVLVDLRTLLVDSRILEHHLNNHSPTSSPDIAVPGVSPAPSELVLRSYIPWNTPAPHSLSPLTPLASQLTYLTIACPSAKWTLPSSTLDALGGVSFLTHLALVRRAHANEDNDAEFVRDVADILSQRAGSLVCVVLVVLPDSGFTAWKYAHQKELVDRLHSLADIKGDAFSLDLDLLLLETYLSTTYIWSQFADLAHSSPVTCVVPGIGDAWSRALKKSRKPGAVFESNIFHNHGRDLWTWASAFEHRRRSARFPSS